MGQPVIEVTVVDTVIEWLEVRNVHDDSHVILYSGTNLVHEQTISNVLLHDFTGDTAVTGLRINGVNVTARNCVVYDGERRGIVVTSNGTAVIENCTVHGMSMDGISSNGGSTVEIRNTISVGNDAAHNDFDLAGTIIYFGYNMYSRAGSFDPGSDQGGSRTPPSSLEDLFFSIGAGLEDFHLEPTGHGAGNRGIDLTSSFTGDVDDETRGTGWDIGADEAVFGTAKPVIISWREIEPQ